ncbi:MFS transporter [Micromonospora sp. IBHARD004]|uniref:MFS transporter n=1 Tax=Micromonospora sp. IBHARD004 TaxID=3457764 RepID=UPI00405938F5
MAVSALSVLVWLLRETRGVNRDPAIYWPEPHLALEAQPRTGPVLVLAAVSYTVPPERQADFVAAMRAVGRSRRRTGAMRWGLFRAGGAAARLRRGLPGAVPGGAPAPTRRPAHRGGPGDRGAGPGARRGTGPGKPPAPGRSGLIGGT